MSSYILQDEVRNKKKIGFVHQHNLFQGWSNQFNASPTFSQWAFQWHFYSTIYRDSGKISFHFIHSFFLGILLRFVYKCWKYESLRSIQILPITCCCLPISVISAPRLLPQSSATSRVKWANHLTFPPNDEYERALSNGKANQHENRNTRHKQSISTLFEIV